MNTAQHQMDATYRQLIVNRIHQRHLLLLLSPKADAHFTVPWRIEG